MLVMTFMSLMTAATLTLFLCNTPIMLGINILALALILAATIATSMSSWYAFLVFLIYIGGMLVMFAYFLALTPNQQMPTTTNMIYVAATILVVAITAVGTSMTAPVSANLSQGNTYLYSSATAYMVIFLALLLLLTMVIVVKLTARSKGPLRPFMYV